MRSEIHKIQIIDEATSLNESSPTAFRLVRERGGVIDEDYWNMTDKLFRLLDYTGGRRALPQDSKMPDIFLDVKKVYKKSPVLEDVLEVIPVDVANCEKFRNALKVPTTGDLREAIDIWIRDEPSHVTWFNLLSSVKESKPAARNVISYLEQPSVYNRYIKSDDYRSFDEEKRTQSTCQSSNQAYP